MNHIWKSYSSHCWRNRTIRQIAFKTKHDGACVEEKKLAFYFCSIFNMRMHDGANADSGVVFIYVAEFATKSTWHGFITISAIEITTSCQDVRRRRNVCRQEGWHGALFPTARNDLFRINGRFSNRFADRSKIHRNCWFAMYLNSMHTRFSFCQFKLLSKFLLLAFFKVF